MFTESVSDVLCKYASIGGVYSAGSYEVRFMLAHVSLCQSREEELLSIMGGAPPSHIRTSPICLVHIFSIDRKKTSVGIYRTHRR